jgi:hypothetical protein
VVSVAFCRAAFVRKSVPEKRETGKGGKSLSAASLGGGQAAQPRTSITREVKSAQATEERKN